MPLAPAHDEKRNVYVFGVTSFLNDVASEMAYWLLPSFLLSIGAGPAKLGIIEGIAESVASFAKLISGYLADRFEHRKPLVTTGYAIANVAKPILAVATRWWHVLIIRFADRTSKGIRGAARDVMLAESVEKEGLGSAFGLLQAMDSAGAIAGPLIALLLISSIGVRRVFWIASIPGIACIFVFLFGARETRVSATAKRKRDAPDRRMHLPFSFWYLLVAVAIFSLGASSDMFLVLRAQNLGVPARHAPLLGLAFNMVYTVAAWPAGKLSDRVSKRAVAAAGYLVYAAVYFIFAAAPDIPLIWAAMATYGLYYSLSDPVLRALVAQTVPDEVRGRAFGIFFSVTSIAMLAASLLAGELWKHYGPNVPFYLSAILALLAATMLLLAPPAPTARADLAPEAHELSAN